MSSPDTFAHKKELHAEPAQEITTLQEAEQVLEMVTLPVKDTADQGIPRTVALSGSNPFRPLLPQDPSRRRAVVLAADNDVWICSSLEIAQAVAGTATGSDAFYLPKGIAVDIRNHSACWVAATTTSTGSRVSVLVEKDANA